MRFTLSLTLSRVQYLVLQMFQSRARGFSRFVQMIKPPLLQSLRLQKQ